MLVGVEHLGVRVARGLGVGLLLLIVVAGLATLLSWWLLPKQGEGRFGCQFSHTVLLPDQTTSVVVQGELLPECPRQLTNLVLVIDASASMDSVVMLVQDKLQEMLQQIDWQQTEVGVVFAYQPNDGRPPATEAELPSTDDLAAISRFLDTYAPNESTELDLELGLALNLLDGSPASSSKLVVLISDGGTSQPDIWHQAVENFARKAASSKAYLVLLGFQTEENLTILQEAANATEHSEFFEANDELELAAFYMSLPELVRTFRQKTEMVLTEPINHEAFGLVGDLDSSATVLRGKIAPTWQYDLQTRQIGWHSIAEGGSVNWFDCDGQTARIQRAAGPTVFTTFPWWGWFSAAILGFLLLLFSWRKRPKESTPATRLPEEPPFVPLPPPGEIPSPAWFVRVAMLPQPLPMPSTTPPPMWPTFFVGLGPTSRPVLERINLNLSEIAPTTDGRPTGVHLLHLDVIPTTESDAFAAPEHRSSHLLTNEQIILRPRLESHTANLQRSPLEYYYISWWAGSRPGQVGQDYDRPAARLALVDDLQMGIGSSSLYAALSRGVSQLNTAVWIITSAADWAGSSLAFDLAHLVRQIGTSGASISSVSLVLLLNNVKLTDLTGESEVDGDSQQRAARVFATFQELTRFGRNQPIRFPYNPKEIRHSILNATSSSVRLVDDVYVVDAGFTLDTTSLLEKPSLADSQQVVNALADTLTAMISGPVRKAIETKTTTIRSQTANNNQVHGAKTHVMSLGGATYRLPLAFIRQYVTVRLAYDFLAYLPGDNESHMLAGLLAERGRQADVVAPVLSWLRGQDNLATHHPLWQQVAALTEGEPGARINTIQNAEPWFKFKLLEKITAILNDEEGQSALPGSRLPLAIRFARHLHSCLQNALPQLDYLSQPPVQQCQQWLMQLIQELDIWSNTLNRQLKELQHELKAREKRVAVELTANYHLVPEAAQDIEGFYQQWVRANGRADQDMLLIGRQRLGWSTRPALAGRLALGVIPLHLPTEKAQWLDSSADHRTALLGLAETLAGHLDRPQPADLLRDPIERHQVAGWLKAHSGAQRGGGMIELKREALSGFEQQLFLLSQGVVKVTDEPSVDGQPGPAVVRPLRELLAHDIQIGQIEATPLDGFLASSVQLLRVVGPVPLDMLVNYEESYKVFARIGRPERLMAFDLEQLQVACRGRLGRDGRFSAVVCAALADIPLARLFAALAATGLIVEKDGQIYFYAADGADSQPVPLGYDWLTALQAFTADQPIGLRRQLKPENRPAFVEQLLRGIRRQERNKPGESYQARQNFQEVVSGLLAEWHEDEPPTDNWFLGVALERLLQESEKR